MPNFLKVLTFGAMLAASSAALANPLNGTLTIDGGDGAILPSTLNSGTTSIAFGAIDEATFYGTGDFSSAGIAFVPFTTPFTFTVGPAFAGEVLFTVTDSFGADAFTVDQVLTAPNGSLTFYGTLADGSSGNFILTPDESANGSFSGTLTAAATPEPGSLILLGTGLIGTLGVVVRRRRTLIEPVLV